MAAFDAFEPLKLYIEATDYVGGVVILCAMPIFLELIMEKHNPEVSVGTIAASCQERGIKLTTKRQSVLYSLLKSHKPVSAYELADKYAEDHKERIPAMSVYRILDFLVKKDFVHKLSSTNKYVACSHITCSHAHQIPQFLICTKCDNVSEIGIARKIVDELKESVEKTGFKLDQQQLELRGVCHLCRTE